MFDYSMSYQIKQVRMFGSIPKTNQNFDDDRITSLMSDEMKSIVVPFILSHRQEYFVVTKDYTIDTTTAPTEYELPSDAAWMKIRDLTLLQQVGTQVTEISIPELSIETVSASYNMNVNYLFGFIIRNNKIILYPGNYLNQQFQMRLYYYRRPLELTNKYGKVTGIFGNQITLSSTPSGFVIGEGVNFIKPEQSFDITNTSVITNVSNPTITVDDATNISIGDFVALEGYSPVPQLAIDAFQYLQQCTVVRVHEAMGDLNAYKVSAAKREELRQALESAITPRVDGSRQVIQNRYSLSRRRW